MKDFLVGIIPYSLSLVFLRLFVPRRLSNIGCLYIAISFSLGLFQSYVSYLPQGGVDAQRFYDFAVQWSSGGFEKAFSLYTGPSSYFISWINALFFAVLGPSRLFTSGLSSLATLAGAIFLLNSASLLGYNAKTKKLIFAFSLFFPVVLLQSALMLREAYVYALFSISLYYLLKWYFFNRFSCLVLSQLFVIACMFFHGAMVVVPFFLILAEIFFLAKKVVSRISRHSKFGFQALILFVFATILVSAIALTPALPKVGELNHFFSDDSADVLIETARTDSSRGDAVHPDWTLINSPNEIPVKLPFRFMYFTLSPFPWDIRHPFQLLGLIDSFFWVVMFACLIKNRRKIQDSKVNSRIILATMLSLLLFSFGVTNFGTGIRHRAKFIPPLILIVAPYVSLPKVRLA